MLRASGGKAAFPPFIQGNHGIDLIDDGLDGENDVAIHEIDGKPHEIHDNPQPPREGIAQYHRGLRAHPEHESGDIDGIPRHRQTENPDCLTGVVVNETVLREAVIQPREKEKADRDKQKGETPHRIIGGARNHIAVAVLVFRPIAQAVEVGGKVKNGRKHEAGRPASALHEYLADICHDTQAVAGQVSAESKGDDAQKANHGNAEFDQGKTLFGRLPVEKARERLPVSQPVFGGVTGKEGNNAADEPGDDPRLLPFVGEFVQDIHIVPLCAE